MKSSFLIYYFYYDKFKNIIIFNCYGFHYNFEYSITELHKSKLLLDYSLDKLYNYINYVLLQTDNNKLPYSYNMPMHRQYTTDYFYHELLNNDSYVIPVSYITTGLVVFLGVWIINIVKSFNNENTYKYKCNSKNRMVNLKLKKNWFFPTLQEKFTKSLDFLGIINKSVVNNISVWTSHISSFSWTGRVNFGLGGAGEDGEDDDKNWKKYFDNLKKNNQRNKLNRKRKQLEKLIAANNQERSELLGELAILTQQIVDQRVYSEGRQWNFTQVEFINNAIQLQRWRERSNVINTRLDQIEVMNQQLNREIIRELDHSYAIFRNRNRKKKT